MTKKSITTFLFTLLISCGIPFAFIGYGLQGCYNHTNLLGTEIEISAVVTDHHESDGDYYSYVDYSYNERTYRRVKFETKSSEKSLTPVGETVTVEIFSDYPKKLASEVPGYSIVSVHIGIILLIVFLFSMISNPLNKDNYSTPPNEIEIKHHLKRKYRNRLMKVIAPIVGGIIYVILMLIFPDFFGTVGPLVCVALALIIVIYYIVNTVRFISIEFHIVKETLVYKREHVNDLGDGPSTTSYYLSFGDDENNSSRSVSAVIYNSVRIGNVFHCVYAGKSAKKPVLAFRDGTNKLVIYF